MNLSLRLPTMTTAFFAATPASDSTVSRGLGWLGGVVQFAVDRNKLRLHVNLRAAREAGLTISSKVLRLAELVGGAGE